MVEETYARILVDGYYITLERIGIHLVGCAESFEQCVVDGYTEDEVIVKIKKRIEERIEEMHIRKENIPAKIL